MECYEGWADEEADYYGWCRRHPSQPRNAVCAACLRDRLSLLCPHCARPRPCRICEPSSSSSFSAASSSAAMTFDATSSSTTSSDLSLDAAAAGDAAAIGSVAPMSHFLGEPSFRRSRSAACGRAPPVPPPADRPRLAPPAEEGKPPRSSASSSSTSTSTSFLLFWRSSVKKAEAKGKVVEGLYRSRTVAGGRGGCQREAEMKGRGWNFRSPMKAFRLSKAEKMLPQRPPLCKG